jgi:hypothetical protein
MYGIAYVWASDWVVPPKPRFRAWTHPISDVPLGRAFGMLQSLIHSGHWMVFSGVVGNHAPTKWFVINMIQVKAI